MLYTVADYADRVELAMMLDRKDALADVYAAERIIAAHFAKIVGAGGPGGDPDNEPGWLKTIKRELRDIERRLDDIGNKLRREYEQKLEEWWRLFDQYGGKR